MKRRTVLTLLAALAAPLAFPNLVGATPYALKGVVSNDAAHVNALAPDWIRVLFGSYLMDYDFGNTKLVLDLALTDDPKYALTVAGVQEIMTHPNYDGWWMVGYNEPDLQGISAVDAATKIIEHIDLVAAVDPLAKFTIAGLSQYNACFKTTYFQTLWNNLPQPIKSKVSAINIHYYPQADTSVVGGNIFKSAPIVTHLTKNRNWMNSHGLTGKELWLTEIGLTKNAFTAAHPNGVNTYPSQVKIACQNGLAQRGAIYLQEGEGTSSYHCLMDNGVLTPMGQTFINI